MKQILRWHIYPIVDELVVHAAQAIVRCAEQAIAKRETFHMVLAGGNTPCAVYEKLRDAKAEWNKWRMYFSDERCVTRDNPNRNDKMAYDAWLKHILISQEQIHSIPAELGAEQGAAAYAKVVSQVDRFDLVLLGLGEDGHTASLFPGHELGDTRDSPDVLPVYDAPKPPPERVSLSADQLSRTRKAFFLVTGESKRRPLADWRRGCDIPARHVVPNLGVDLFVDMRAMPDWETGI